MKGTSSGLDARNPPPPPSKRVNALLLTAAVAQARSPKPTRCPPNGEPGPGVKGSSTRLMKLIINLHLPRRRGRDQDYRARWDWQLLTRIGTIPASRSGLQTERSEHAG